MATQNLDSWWNNLSSDEKKKIYARVEESSIVPIYPSDIISDSMHKINYNFEILASRDDVSNQKFDWLKEQYDNLFENLKKYVDENDNNLGNALDSLNDKIDNIKPMFDIEDLINDAIANATIDLQRFITETEFQNGLNQALGQYVRSVDIDGILAGKDYITSAAFDEMMADSTTGNAYAQRMVANAEFYKEYNTERGKDCFVYQNTEKVSKFADLDEYYEEVKHEVDPDGKGMMDEGVVDRLVKKAEQVFMIIYKQLSLIKQSVTNSEASIDIMAALNGNDGERIVSAIFLKATEMGSFMELYADQIIMNAEHQLKLETDEFQINSTNFKVTPSGKVTATDITLSGNVVAEGMKSNNMTANNMYAKDITAVNMNASNVTANGITAIDITLKSKNGVTKIDEDGILWAHGAKIDGDITAQRFLATEESVVEASADTNNYGGTITKNTVINGSSFGISADGSLSNGSNSVNVTGNSLYIELSNVLENEKYGTNDIPDQYMYGVPVLCMNYVDQSGHLHKYVLDPSSWKDLSRTVSSSDMRWYEQYSVLDYKFNAPSTQTNYYYKESLPGSYALAGTLYMFNPNNSSQFITNNGLDTVYRLNINRLDDSPSTTIGYLKDNLLVKNSSSVNASNINNYTAYALKSLIDRFGGTAYCGPAASMTEITNDLCGDFRKYLQNNLSLGVVYRFTNYFSELPSIDDDTYGLNNLYDFIIRATGGEDDIFGKPIKGNDMWKISGIINGVQRDNIDAEVRNLKDNLPFCSGGRCTTGSNSIQGQEYYYSVSAYPIINITDYGKEVATSTNLIYVTCSIGISGYYAYTDSVNTNLSAIECVAKYNDWTNDNYPTYQQMASGGILKPHHIDSHLNFDCVFSLGGIQFNPLDPQMESTIMSKVYDFLKKFPFSGEDHKGKIISNSLKDYAQFYSTFEATFKIPSNYGGTTDTRVILTKNTIDPSSY